MIQKQDASHRDLKNLLINPRFQFKFLSYFIGLFFLTTLSLYSTTYLFFWNMKQKALSVGIPDGHVFYRFLNNQKNDLDHLFIGLAIFNFLLLIGVGFIISHRIAGPIHKMKSYLFHMDSNQEDFKLRESDFFPELGPMVKSLKEKSKS
jgi:hypothetical protein